MGHVPLEPFKWLAIPAVIFTAIGSALVSIAPKVILILIVGCIAIISSFQLGYQTYQSTLALDSNESHQEDLESEFEENKPPDPTPIEIEKPVDILSNYCNVCSVEMQTSQTEMNLFTVHFKTANAFVA